MKTFSPRAKRILMVLAQDEARKLGSKQLFPEHELLAIIKLKEGIGYSVFERLGLNPAKFQLLLEDFFKEEKNNPTLEELPKSRRYKVMLDIADIESSALHNDYIGTEHLLLAAIREEGSIASKFFATGSYGIMDVRFTVMDLQNVNESSANKSIAEDLVDSVFRSLLDESAENLFGAFEEKKKLKEKEFMFVF